MSNYGDYMKKMAEKNDNFFFGEGNKQACSNKYYTFKHYLNDDEIIINTGNIKVIKGNYVMIVDNNKGVYLKDWQVRQAHNWGDICSDFYLVKLNRKYFKPYTFRFTFDDIWIQKEESFDDLVEIAKEQDKVAMRVANGWMSF